MLEELLKSREWETSPFVPPGNPVGMLGVHEGSLFYYLAKDAYTGSGAIVDAGSFLGRSAICLASGLRANPRIADKRRRVHCYDNFRVNDDLTVRYIAERLQLDLAIGDSTRTIFDRQVAGVAEHLVVHAGDFHAERWDGGPIEILMVDIAKRQSLWGHVLNQHFPQLMPGRSLVIHQDYHHFALPHIHVVMEDLRDHFELVITKADDSAVFLYSKRIPDHRLQRAAEYRYSAAERMDLMNRALQRLPEGQRGGVELARVMLAATDGDLEWAKQELRRLEEKPVDKAKAKWWEWQLVALRRQVSETEAWTLFKRKDFGECAVVSKRLLEEGSGKSVHHYLRGVSLLELGERDEAETHLRAALEQVPAIPWARIALSRLLQQRGQHEEAQELLMQSLDGSGEHAPPPRVVYEALGRLWVANPDPSRVRAGQERLRRSRGEDAEFHLFDARVRLVQGDRDGAQHCLHRASELGLDADRLREATAELAL